MNAAEVGLLRVVRRCASLRTGNEVGSTAAELCKLWRSVKHRTPLATAPLMENYIAACNAVTSAVQRSPPWTFGPEAVTSVCECLVVHFGTIPPACLGTLADRLHELIPVVPLRDLSIHLYFVALHCVEKRDSYAETALRRLDRLLRGRQSVEAETMTYLLAALHGLGKGQVTHPALWTAIQSLPLDSDELGDGGGVHLYRLMRHLRAQHYVVESFKQTVLECAAQRAREGGIDAPWFPVVFRHTIKVSRGRPDIVEGLLQGVAGIPLEFDNQPVSSLSVHGMCQILEDINSAARKGYHLASLDQALQRLRDIACSKSFVRCRNITILSVLAKILYLFSGYNSKKAAPVLDWHHAAVAQHLDECPDAVKQQYIKVFSRCHPHLSPITKESLKTAVFPILEDWLLHSNDPQRLFISASAVTVMASPEEREALFKEGSENLLKTFDACKTRATGGIIHMLALLVASLPKDVAERLVAHISRTMLRSANPDELFELAVAVEKHLDHSELSWVAKEALRRPGLPVNKALGRLVSHCFHKYSTWDIAVSESQTVMDVVRAAVERGFPLAALQGTLDMRNIFLRLTGGSQEAVSAVCRGIKAEGLSPRQAVVVLTRWRPVKHPDAALPLLEVILSGWESLQMREVGRLVMVSSELLRGYKGFGQQSQASSATSSKKGCKHSFPVLCAKLVHKVGRKFQLFFDSSKDRPAEFVSDYCRALIKWRCLRLPPAMYPHSVAAVQSLPLTSCACILFAYVAEGHTIHEDHLGLFHHLANRFVGEVDEPLPTPCPELNYARILVAFAESGITTPGFYDRLESQVLATTPSLDHVVKKRISTVYYSIERRYTRLPIDLRTTP